MRRYLFFLAFILISILTFTKIINGSKILNDYCIAESNDSTRHGSADIAVNQAGNFVVTWLSVFNENDPNVFFPTTEINGRQYQIDGNPLTPVFRIDKECSGGDPSLDINNAGNFIVVWWDNPICFQRYNSHAEPQGGNVRIISVSAKSSLNTAVGIDGTGNITVLWDNFYVPRGIFRQRFNADGDSVGSAFRINNQYFEEIWNPAIAVSEAGNFIVIWEKGRYGVNGIYGQLFDKNGQPDGVNFKISGFIGNACHSYSSVAIDSSGNIIAVVWQDNHSGDYEIYCQLYHSGVPFGSNFKVNEDDNDSTSWYIPAIAMDESGKFVITWSDKRNGDFDIYGQCYNSYGEAIGKNFIINSERKKNQLDPSVDLKNGLIYNTWTDSSIWANVIEFPDISSIDKKYKIPDRFELPPNFPNPFNPTTTFQYALKEETKVSIKIYNLLGKEIATLVNEIQPTGYQSVIWNGTDRFGNPVPSGIYICKMIAGNFIKSQKMVLMK
jgi:hypothetical protein